MLDPDLFAGQAPQAVVPAQIWQTARSWVYWTRAGCILSPAFDFSGLEMAPLGWTPASTARS